MFLGTSRSSIGEVRIHQCARKEAHCDDSRAFEAPSNNSQTQRDQERHIAGNPPRGRINKGGVHGIAMRC